MNRILAIVTVVFVLALGGLAWFSYSTHGKLQLAKAEVEQAKAELVLLQEQKEQSDAAIANLTLDLAKQQAVTTRTITKLVRVPVSPDESCMSPVLREALKENQE